METPMETLHRMAGELCPILGGRQPEARAAEWALKEIERLREWIRHDSEVNDTCTFHVLGEICQECGCQRKVPNDEGKRHE